MKIVGDTAHLPLEEELNQIANTRTEQNKRNATMAHRTQKIFSTV